MVINDIIQHYESEYWKVEARNGNQINAMKMLHRDYYLSTIDACDTVIHYLASYKPESEAVIIPYNGNDICVSTVNRTTTDRTTTVSVLKRVRTTIGYATKPNHLAELVVQAIQALDDVNN